MSKRWYVVHVYSGMEKSVHKALVERIEREGLESSFGRILVPSEEVIEVKGGKKSITERRIRSEEHTSELQSLMRISYAVFCLKKKTTKRIQSTTKTNTTKYKHKLKN